MKCHWLWVKTTFKDIYLPEYFPTFARHFDPGIWTLCDQKALETMQKPSHINHTDSRDLGALTTCDPEKNIE